MDIKQNLKQIKSGIPNNVKLVAVSKRQPNESILLAYEVGQRVFGENRHKELIEKYNSLPKDIEWHFIGSLQRTNVKYVVPIVNMIHSVDSDKLLKEIDKEAAKNSKIIDVLFEVHLAKEQTKSGWDMDSLIDYISKGGDRVYSNIRVRGVMCMATYTSDECIIREEFKQLKSLFEKLKDNYYKQDDSFDTISAGMSSDYKIAIECNSNMIRIGSLIF